MFQKPKGLEIVTGLRNECYDPAGLVSCKERKLP